MWGWRWGCKRAAPQLCSLLRADPDTGMTRVPSALPLQARRRHACDRGLGERQPFLQTLCREESHSQGHLRTARAQDTLTWTTLGAVTKQRPCAADSGRSATRGRAGSQRARSWRGAGRRARSGLGCCTPWARWRPWKGPAFPEVNPELEG